MTRSASRASLELEDLVDQHLELALLHQLSSFSMSLRIQPLEPSTLSSKVQMKRMSSVGA